MTQDDRLLRRAAERSRLRPEYIGWILAQYGEIEGLVESQVQEHLRVSPDNWPRLHLCLRPRADQFLQDVATIAQEFGISRDTLAAMVRRVEGLHILAATTKKVEGQPGSRTQKTSDCPGHLLAARSRNKKQRKPNNDQESVHES